MIRVGIIISASKGWMGGVNYLKNLLQASLLVDGKKIKFVLFFGEKTEAETLSSFENIGEIVKTKLLDNDNTAGFINGVFLRIFGGSFLMNEEFIKNKIDVVSHSRIFFKNNRYKTINWIPDFQHLHMPEMFSFMENRYRNYLFGAYARFSDAVILSSHDAQKDFLKKYEKYKEKNYVLQFVSQANKNIYNIENAKSIQDKYDFSGKFFYLPNQLWKHKNHMVVLKALRELKKANKQVLVLCSGFLGDYRNKSYFEEVKQYIQDNDLQDNVKFLGLIDYVDVLTLMRHCVSIINPSLFEGWSSTVEEAKSVGKNMILSDLKVHREQNPPESVYFDPQNAKDLADKMWDKWIKSMGGPDLLLEEIARKNMEKRTREFGMTYQDIVLRVMADK